jgi:hypothetical protein
VRVVPLSRPPVDDDIKRAVLAAIDSRQYTDEEIDRVIAAVHAFFGA